MFASHHGSSSSNSLSNCAQSHTTSFTTTTAMDVEPTHVTQANENPNTITTVSQHIINLSSVEAVSGSFVDDCVPQDNSPSADDAQSEMTAKRVGEEVKYTTGALSDQDNNLINVKNFQNINSSGETVESWKLENQDANNDSNKLWSVTPHLNIPKSQGKGVTAEYDKPFLVAAMNATTVQGKTDSNPPPSFNNRNSSSIVTNHVEGMESFVPGLLIQYATQLTRYCSASDEGPATNARWGIPPGLGLRGGGESSLNSGTSSWGTPSGGNSNNNNNSNSSAGGWGGNTQGQGNASAQSQWGNNNNSVNRNAGTGGSSQGPSGQQNAGKCVNAFVVKAVELNAPLICILNPFKNPFVIECWKLQAIFHKKSNSWSYLLRVSFLLGVVWSLCSKTLYCQFLACNITVMCITPTRAQKLKYIK
jgi:hypothetical protein